MTAADLFPSPRGDAARRLSELAARRAELRTEVSGLRTATTAATAERDQVAAALRAARAREHAFGDAAAEVKASEARLTKIDKAAEARADRLRVASDAAAAVDTAITDHACEHADDLAAELREDATHAASRLAAAVAEFDAAHSAWLAAGLRGEEMIRLTRPEMIRTHRVPPLPDGVGEFGKLAGRAAGSILLPVPAPFGHGEALAAESQGASA